MAADLTLDKHILSEVVRKNSKAGATARAGALDPRPLPDRRGSIVSARRALESRLVQAQRCEGSVCATTADPGYRPSVPAIRCQRIHVMLRREGWPVNKKRVRRLYRLEGL